MPIIYYYMCKLILIIKHLIIIQNVIFIKYSNMFVFMRYVNKLYNVFCINIIYIKPFLSYLI